MLKNFCPDIFNRYFFWNPAVFAQTANDYIDRGIAKGNQKNPKGAIEEFNKAIKLSPTMPKHISTEELQGSLFKTIKEL